MSKDNGGPAFPVESIRLYPGMTLRDYFAAKAMQGFMDAWWNDEEMEQSATAKIAYEFADAMLAERAK